jgi:pyruvate dehydrogenase E2 component (dihydrolipoamide acetyltransferase)
MFRILLARQGQTMEQGTLVNWLKRVDDSFAIGDDLYEIETEKAIVVIQATRPGRLARIVAMPNDVVPVGALLAIAAEAGETPSVAEIDALVADKSTDAAAEAATGDDDSAPPAAPAGTRTVTAMPKARALAQELGVDLAAIAGSGAGGVITPDDVRQVSRPGPAPAAAVAPDPRITRRVPLSPIGRSTVAALDKATRTPQFTQGILVDASALVRRKEAAGGGLAYMDLFLDAVVAAARRVPEVLARLAEREILYFGSIDVSILATTDHGLLLAVLRDAGASDIRTRGAQWRSLVERARQGRLSVPESTGGLIALSNLGTRGVDSGTALLPADHAAIVFVGSIEKRAIAVGDKVEARPTVHVSVTYDHKVIDGVLGARFTTALREALEQPV